MMIVELPEEGTAEMIVEEEDTAATAGEATMTVVEATTRADLPATDTIRATRETLVDLLPATATAAADRVSTIVVALLPRLRPCLKAPLGVHLTRTVATLRPRLLLVPSTRSTAAASARGRVAGETTRSRAVLCLLLSLVV